jgi:polar amino acid transport system substrate-binding protein
MTRSRRSSPTSAPFPTVPSLRQGAINQGAYRAIGATLVVVAAAAASLPASARSLASIQARGIISLCAHPNALPFARRGDGQRGFQIELGHAIARHLGVGLDVAWIVSPIQYRAAECDIILDTIVDPQVQAESRIRVSKPYHRSGVALALSAGADGIRSFRDLDRRKRIGVQSGSLAQMILGQLGFSITSFGFEDEIIEALVTGAIDAAAVSPASVGYFNLRHPNQAVTLVHAYEQEPALSWNVAVGMRGGDAPLTQKIDAAIERLLTEGVIRDIYARYGIEHRPPAVSR